jgi:hypothetical protein
MELSIIQIFQEKEKQMNHISQNAKHVPAKYSLWGLAWLVISVIFLTGCSAAAEAKGASSPAAGAAVQISAEAQNYVDLSRESLVEKLGLPADQIVVDHITEPADPNGIYTIVFVVKDQTYEFHGQNLKVTLVEDGMPTVTLDSDEIAKSEILYNVPAVASTDQTPYWAVSPEHVEIEFSDYAHPETSLQPKVYVYPVAELVETNQENANQVSMLKELLTKNKDLATTKSLPLLPLFNAQAMFYAQARYQSFANGSGIRYLTQVSQAASPINNHELFYSFQGLTNDGKYYVAAIFPVAQSDLPANTTGTDMSFSDGFETYIQNVQDTLEGAVPNSFNPSLAILDHLAQTISIQK